jgi:hypothetical protein
MRTGRTASATEPDATPPSAAPRLCPSDATLDQDSDSGVVWEVEAVEGFGREEGELGSLGLPRRVGPPRAAASGDPTTATDSSSQSVNDMLPLPVRTDHGGR